MINAGIKRKANTVAVGPKEAKRRQDGTITTGVTISILTLTAPLPVKDGTRHRSASVFIIWSTVDEGTTWHVTHLEWKPNVLHIYRKVISIIMLHNYAFQINTAGKGKIKSKQAGCEGEKLFFFLHQEPPAICTHFCVHSSPKDIKKIPP